LRNKHAPCDIVELQSQLTSALFQFILHVRYVLFIP
jgi:hypothetical protein